MEIREYRDSDWKDVWEILKSVFQAGDTFPNSPETNEQEAWDYWIKKPKYTFVAITDKKVVGSYHLKDNQSGLGSHVGNAGYVVSPTHRGFGIGHSLAQHSIDFAVEAGYLALQFNLVVATNKASIALWKKLGFQKIGTLPKAFNHKKIGFVDAYVMFKPLI
ncbi:N-acetyltransferase family protein [Microbulbifer echini]|uniref:N-acetyltransferase family protein n=1 Tax=Microbulbifer echini TaxID=1529067 RepID=A0ABV4NLK1_9GAMM|nr:GNAT family N-acetyltransferase [uncultured Microbulbifer sp.]